MSAVTVQDVSSWSEREGLYVFIGAAFNSASQRLIGFVLLPFLAIFVLILAQLYPISMRKTLREVGPLLPDVQDTAALETLRDALLLALGAGRFYSRVCLLQRKMNDVLDEIEEHIDSLNLVLESPEALQALLDEGERQNAPELPLNIPPRSRQLEVA